MKNVPREQGIPTKPGITAEEGKPPKAARPALVLSLERKGSKENKSPHKQDLFIQKRNEGNLSKKLELGVFFTKFRAGKCKRSAVKRLNTRGL